MGLLKAFAREVQSAKLSSRQMPTNPSRVAAAVNDGVNESCFMRNRVINREGKFFGQQPVKVFMRLQMDARVEAKRFDVRVDAVEKIRTKAGLLFFVKMETVEQVKLGQIKNFNFHGSCLQSIFWPSPSLQNAPCLQRSIARAHPANRGAIEERECFFHRAGDFPKAVPSPGAFLPRSFVPLEFRQSCPKISRGR